MLNHRRQEMYNLHRPIFNSYFNPIFNPVSTSILYLFQWKAKSCVLLKLDLRDLNLSSLLKEYYPNSLPFWASHLLFLHQQAA